MIDISGREFGIELGRPLWIRTWIALRLPPFLLCMGEQKMASVQSCLVECKLFILIHSAGLCSHGPWTIDMKLSIWFRSSLNQSNQSAQARSKKNNPSLQMISPTHADSFGGFVSTRAIDMNLDPLILAQSPERKWKQWFDLYIVWKLLGARFHEQCNKMFGNIMWTLTPPIPEESWNKNKTHFDLSTERCWVRKKPVRKHTNTLTHYSMIYCRQKLTF